MSSRVYNQNDYDLISLLRTMVVSYNNNIEAYNNNISRILHLLQERNLHSTYRQPQNIYENRTARTPRPSYRTALGTQNPDVFGLRSPTSNPSVYTFNIPIRMNSQTTTNRLTREQIQNGTQIIQYDISMDEIRCPISLEDFILDEQICRIRGCNHIFKTANLMRWFETHIDCPVCRYDLRRWNSGEQPDVFGLRPPTSNPSASALRTTASGTSSTENTYDFLPILENILEETTEHFFGENLTTNMAPRPRPRSNTIDPILDRRRHGQRADIGRNTTGVYEGERSTTEDGSIGSQISQIISDMIFERIPTSYDSDVGGRSSNSYDISNNLMYTIDFSIIR